jgi:hypothetical protein
VFNLKQDKTNNAYTYYTQIRKQAQNSRSGKSRGATNRQQ